MKNMKNTIIILIIFSFWGCKRTIPRKIVNTDIKIDLPNNCQDAILTLKNEIKFMSPYPCYDGDFDTIKRIFETNKSCFIGKEIEFMLDLFGGPPSKSYYFIKDKKAHGYRYCFNKSNECIYNMKDIGICELTGSYIEITYTLYKGISDIKVVYMKMEGH